MAFDISSIEQSDTTIVELLHPGTGANTGATITVYGEDSEVGQKLQRKSSARYAEFAQRHGFKKVMPGEQAEDVELKKNIGHVAAWEGFTEKGKPLECNPENIERIFKQFPSFLEQCKTAVGDRSLFIKG